MELRCLFTGRIKGKNGGNETANALHLRDAIWTSHPWPLAPLRPRRSAYGVAGLRSEAGQANTPHALMAKLLASKPRPKLFHLTYNCGKVRSVSVVRLRDTSPYDGLRRFSAAVTSILAINKHVGPAGETAINLTPSIIASPSKSFRHQANVHFALVVINCSAMAS